MDSKNQTQKREIKFRGKRIDTGEWVVGNLVMVCNGETLKRYPCIVISYNHDSFDWHEVHPDSVGQFTGLNDKNGKEIYEGDILEFTESDLWLYGNRSPVDFYRGSFYCTMLYDLTMAPLFEMPTVYNPNDYPNNTEKSLWIADCDVIGNVFENPELL